MDWLGGALAEIGREDLREMSHAAGLPVRVSGSKKWLPVSELREALGVYLAPEAEKVGGCMHNEVMSQLIELSIREKGSF